MPPPSPSARAAPALMAAAVSLCLAAVKTAGFWLTGSAALLAAAADSAADVIVSGLGALTIRAAGAPPDAGHPFGHGKFENLGALAQAIILAAVGSGVLWKSFHEGLQDAPLERPALGIAIAIASSVVAVLLSKYLDREGRRHDSPALIADAAHYRTDWLVNFGILAAFGAEALFGWHAVDPFVGALVAAAILRMAWTTGADAVNALSDVRLASEEIAIIDRVLRTHAPVVRGYHDLLTRRSGRTRFVQLHVEIQGELGFRDAHRIVERVVRDLEAAMPHAVVTIHADPHPQLPNDEETHPARNRKSAVEVPREGA